MFHFSNVQSKLLKLIIEEISYMGSDKYLKINKNGNDMLNKVPKIRFDVQAYY